uniref:Uncharacterized protein n=1 Tax=Amphimedon queenslandica TaxID=400682 RepID=A0A1X7T1Y4_AMPQE
MNPKHTIDPDIVSKTIVIENPHTTVELHLYDTAGQERHKTLTRQFYRNADIALLVFSIDDGDSFHHIEQVWRQEVLKRSEKDDVKMILIGNKADLYEERVNEVSTSEEYARRHGMKFIEMSAIRKDDYQKVDSVLRETAAEIVRQGGRSSSTNEEHRPVQRDEVIHIEPVPNPIHAAPNEPQQEQQKNKRCAGKQLQIIFIGDSDVGKTSIFKLFENHEVFKFKPPVVTTDAQTIERNVVIGPPHETVKLYIYDTAGQWSEKV